MGPAEGRARLQLAGPVESRKRKRLYYTVRQTPSPVGAQTMITIQRVLRNKGFSRSIDALVLILVCLLVPYTHGYLQYLGLVVAAFTLIAVKYVVFQARYR